MKCPVCEDESTNTHKCTNCGWEFVNFTEEPTIEEQNEYTQLLNNYRTELYFALAVQYYDNKQYEEVIECCRISCEHQLFENPLALMASAYFELGNKEEALSFAHMALEINSTNELAITVLKTLQEEKDNYIIPRLSDEILLKGQFEKQQEYENRVNNLSYVKIGTVKLINYDADNEILNFRSEPYRIIKLNSLYLDGEFIIKVAPVDAKKLYKNTTVSLIAKLHITNNIIDIIDIKVEQYSFMKELENIKKLKMLQEKEKKEKGDIAREYNNFKNNIPRIWKDSLTNIELGIKIFDIICLDDISYSPEIFKGWTLPTYAQFNSLLESLKSQNTLAEKAILDFILEDDKVYRILEDKKDRGPGQMPYTNLKPYSKQYTTPFINLCYMIVYKKEKSFFEKLWN